MVGRATLDAKDPRKLAVTPLAPQASGGPGARLLINASTSLDLYTEKKFGDCTIEVEFMIPKGSNSGVYVMGEYEVQILDSYGKKKMEPSDMGGIYTTAAPKVNACKKPGEWQTLDIVFKAPRFDANGKKIANARFVKVVFNGKLIHENVDVPTPTGHAWRDKEVAQGPLLLQADHGPVAFRKVRVRAYQEEKN